MFNNDYTAKLLNLEDFIITNVENFSEEVHVCLELPRVKHRCPACGALTDRVHDYRMQRIKDGRHVAGRAAGAGFKKGISLGDGKEIFHVPINFYQKGIDFFLNDGTIKSP